MSPTKQRKSATTWVVDEDRVRQAQKILKLRYRPIVSIETHVSEFYWGRYDPDPLHIVWINPTVPSIKEGSLTIWHELAHAMQCERDFDCDSDAFLLQANLDRYALVDPEQHGLLAETDNDEWVRLYYALQPFEQEAEDLAQTYAPKIPLLTIA